MFRSFRERNPRLSAVFPLLAILIFAIFWFNLLEPLPQRWQSVPTFDTVFFIKMAENILRHGEFGWLGYHEPCLFPLAIAGFSFLTGDIFGAAVLVSRISVLLLLISVYLLARETFGARIAAASTLLVLFHPHIGTFAATTQSEALYAFLITLSIYLLWRAWREQSYRLAILGGGGFAVSYLTRSEGIFILLFLLSALVIIAWKRRAMKQGGVKVLGAALITFTLCSAPYITYLTKHYGALTVGTKTSGIYFWVRAKCFDDPDPERREWGLSPKGELNLISMTSKDLMGYWRKDLARSARVYLKNLKEEIPGFVPNDGGMRHFPQVYPIYLVAPLIFGLALRMRRRESLEAEGYLLSVFLILLVFPLLTGGWWRYLVNYAPVMIVLAARGVDETVSFFPGRGAPQSNRWWKGLFWVFVATVCLYHIWVVRMQEKPAAVREYLDSKAVVAEETRKAGEYIRRVFPADTRFMAQWTRLPLYFEGKWTALPEDTYSNILWYARKNDVDYIILEVQGRSEFERLKTEPMPGLAFASAYESNAIEHYFVFFKMLK